MLQLAQLLHPFFSKQESSSARKALQAHRLSLREPSFTTQVRCLVGVAAAAHALKLQGRWLKRLSPTTATDGPAGAKQFGYNKNGCAQGDYAEIVLPRGVPGEFDSYWIPAGDLKFCQDSRVCGTTVR